MTARDSVPPPPPSKVGRRCGPIQRMDRFMRLISAGEFVMGSTPGGGRSGPADGQGRATYYVLLHETPQFAILLPAFYMVRLP